MPTSGSHQKVSVKYVRLPGSELYLNHLLDTRLWTRQLSPQPQVLLIGNGDSSSYLLGLWQRLNNPVTEGVFFSSACYLSVYSYYLCHTLPGK